jgi:PqqD family protein of HPr-rel-A system
MSVAYTVLPGLVLSPIWEDGAACLLANTGQTFALSSFSARLVRLLQRSPNISLGAMTDRFATSKGSEGLVDDELRQLIGNVLAEFERLGIVSRVTH